MTSTIYSRTLASRILIWVFSTFILYFASLANTWALSGFEVETVAWGLAIPTAMTFAPDGRIFVAQKWWTVQVIKNGVLLNTPLITLTDVNNYGDRWLIGIAIDPNFASNGYLYLSYTYENSPGTNIAWAKTGRIVRITVNWDRALE